MPPSLGSAQLLSAWAVLARAFPKDSAQDAKFRKSSAVYQSIPVAASKQVTVADVQVRMIVLPQLDECPHCGLDKSALFRIFFENKIQLSSRTTDHSQRYNALVHAKRCRVCVAQLCRGHIERRKARR
jgi:hypothetical protein